MREHLLRLAAETPGFLPVREGEALYRAGLASAPLGPLLEVGSYCGLSALFLGAAAEEVGTVLFSIDHHRGSEEHQPGEEYHDPHLMDARLGLLDTLPAFRRTIARARLESAVVAVVGRSEVVGRYWAAGDLGLVFIDGGHSEAAAQLDYECWSAKVVRGGTLAIHDVFPDPAKGGQAPWHAYQRALTEGNFVAMSEVGSLRLLRRI